MPAGKVAVICVSLFTANGTEVPLKFTLVALVKLYPVMIMFPVVFWQISEGEKEETTGFGRQVKVSPLAGTVVVFVRQVDELAVPATVADQLFVVDRLLKSAFEAPRSPT
jgi:hypothetical protein